MISIKEITIEIAGREIISDYSKQIHSGSITVIVGPNGSGKSTLLAAIAGDIIPSKGTITIDDIHPSLTSAMKLSTIRAMAVQNQFYSLGFTVRQIIEMAGDAGKVIYALDLNKIADRQVTTLSVGELQRVAIAQAIAQNTPVLLLDEPLAAQDINSRERIIKLLQNLAKTGVTIVVIAHEAEKDLVWANIVLRISL
ncbi:MAG: ABC transporter ATP-binding protein [Actinobacteria bacterium]|nr:ABC transporter ATP-binding protein [Actinomycetota bacterium]MCX6439527.1 ABC transporter ATP-binding protein [Actinomycetota bacterium]